METTVKPAQPPGTDSHRALASRYKLTVEAGMRVEIDRPDLDEICVSVYAA
jgi:hypothetical protein